MEHRQQVTVAENKTFPQLVPPTKEKLLLYLEINGLSRIMTPHEKDYFVETAQAYCLNPFKREIHCVPRGTGDKRVIALITGYDVYIKRAERTGKLDGYGFVTEGKSPALKTIITIYRKDWSHPFEYEVNFDEVVQRNRDGSISYMWAKMPKFMLRKVAIAQGFRLCFPDELGGMPYTADELAEGMGIPNAVVEEPETPTTKPQSSPVAKGLDLTEEEKHDLINVKRKKH
ncbi:MAG: phage recombination protein Bet [Elusimicrobiaceae bacterium]|nr:phage recombination protein Bet [Elusimicrobiaceae bacterium]